MMDKETPLKLRGVQGIIAHLQQEISKVLEQDLEDTTQVDISKLIINKLSESMPGVDIESNFSATCTKGDGEFIFVPNNLITAIWMKGIPVNPKDIINKHHYEDAFAIYQFDEFEGLRITPKTKSGLFD